MTGGLIMMLLLSLLAVPAVAAGAWNSGGYKIWLEPGQGINLLTGGAGDDLVFRGETVTARYGAVVLSNGDLDRNVAPPADGYTTTLRTMDVQYSRLMVRLYDGSVAQVKVGMASTSGLIYTGLFLDEWIIREGDGAPPAAPAQAPAPKPAGTAPGSGQTSPKQSAAVRLQVGSAQAEANGVAYTLDVGPQYVNGELVLPLRFVAEALGLSLKWDGREQKVSISGDSLTMTLWAGQSRGVKNGEPFLLMRPITMVGNRLMVPLKGIVNALSDAISYDEKTGVIQLERKAGAVQPTDPAPTDPAPTKPDPGQTNQGTVHFAATWLNKYKNGWVSTDADALPDFYLTLHPDGSAEVVQTITGLWGASYVKVNMHFKGSYTLNPLQATLKLQPAGRGWETREYTDPAWQELTVTGDLAPDWSHIENLVIDGKAAKTWAYPTDWVPTPTGSR